MKRTLAVLLILTLLLPLVACGGGTSLVPEEETETLIRTAGGETAAADAGPHEVTGFCVGFGRTDITPTASVPLGGYGNSEYRMSKTILDPLYCTCVALQDEAGERVLFFQFDLGNPGNTFGAQVRSMVSKATGVPEDHTVVNMTHTHSAPDLSIEGGNWLISAYRASVQAAKDALADLDACTGISVGAAETDRLNFVRRYYKENGFCCDNAEYGTGEITGHESPVDQELRVVRLARKNQPDVLLTNWQCHNHLTGGSSKYDVSSDFVGAFQQVTEKKLGVKTIYLQGGAGNINPTSRIAGEGRFSYYRDTGNAMYETLAGCLKSGMKEVGLGALRAEKRVLTCAFTHEDEEKIPQCEEIRAAWSANDRAKAFELCATYDLSSPFEADAIYWRSYRGESGEVEVYCFSFGDVALAVAPFEMFCQTYEDLRARSPFEMTLTLGYSNVALGYMPAAECWANRGYEVVTCRYVKGTAEQIEEAQLEMLTELKAK